MQVKIGFSEMDLLGEDALRVKGRIGISGEDFEWEFFASEGIPLFSALRAWVEILNQEVSGTYSWQPDPLQSELTCRVLKEAGKWEFVGDSMRIQFQESALKDALEKALRAFLPGAMILNPDLAGAKDVQILVNFLEQ